MPNLIDRAEEARLIAECNALAAAMFPERWAVIKDQRGKKGREARRMLRRDVRHALDRVAA